jgi:hypothetical protein
MREPYQCPVCGKESWHPDDARHGHCAACGANRLGPGYYEVGGTLHLVVPELLESEGYELTPENVDVVTRRAHELLGELGIPVVETRGRLHP